MGGRSATLLFGLSLFVCACADGDEGAPAVAGQIKGGTGEVSCDPLASGPQPIALTDVVAVGRSSSGTLYVLEGGFSSESRVFVSSGQTLVRKRVLGSGANGGPGGDAEQSVSYEDGAMPNRLVFTQRAGTVTGMALVHDEDRSFFDALPASAERLTVVSPSVLAKLTPQNLPGEVVLEHAAHTEEGVHIFVTRPRDDASYEDFRVFVGDDNVFKERGAVKASRGSATWIAFDLSGQEALAVFANPVFSPNLSSSLTTSSGETLLVLDDVMSGLPAGASFRCLR